MPADHHQTCDNRPLTDAERHLARWMLKHGKPEAHEFLPQLELAEVTPGRCPCGCASINFQIKGRPLAPPEVHILAEFVFGDDEGLSGIFMFEKAGILSGLEVCGLATDARRPRCLHPSYFARCTNGPDTLNPRTASTLYATAQINVQSRAAELAKPEDQRHASGRTANFSWHDDRDVLN